MRGFEAPQGATPIEDAEGLLLFGVSTLADLSAAEAENILNAAAKRLRRRNNPKRRWLTEEFLRVVHKEMFGEVWSWAGRYRAVELNIGVAPHRIREEIAKLCDDAWFWGSEAKDPPSALERACRVHHRLSWIHPFRNGNGRHARLIADIYLKSCGESMPIWPSKDIASKGGVRDEYLAALRSGDRGDFRPLMDLVSRFSANQREGPSGL